MKTAFVIAVAVLAATAVRAHPAKLPPRCLEALDRAFEQWRYLAPPPEARKWAGERRIDPAVARADLDADGRADFAVLVRASGTPHLVVCMGRKRGTEVLVVERPYCSDLVYRSRAGKRYYDFETGRYAVLARDGVSVSCFEKAGATYVYEKGALRRIVDSD